MSPPSPLSFGSFLFHLFVFVLLSTPNIPLILRSLLCDSEICSYQLSTHDLLPMSYTNPVSLVVLTITILINTSPTGILCTISIMRGLTVIALVYADDGIAG
jgi:hypothetical protein